jgi:hypothetical protein
MPQGLVASGAVVRGAQGADTGPDGAHDDGQYRRTADDADYHESNGYRVVVPHTTHGTGVMQSAG